MTDETTTDTPAQAAARAWLHSYGVNTSRYQSDGADHPIMLTLPDAFEAFARKMRDEERERCAKIADAKTERAIALSEMESFYAAEDIAAAIRKGDG